MTQIKNNINTYADLTAYNADTNKDYPNVSYIVASDEVKWVESDPLLVIIYNVTSTSSATELISTTWYECIDKQYIDGIEQQNVKTRYTFDTTGRHTVKYRLTQNYLYKSLFLTLGNIIEVQIPNNVTTIQESAFNACSNLTSVKLPKGLITVEKNIFANDSTLTNVELPETLTVVGEGMLRQTAITTITIPNTVTSIGANAFIACDSLATVIIGTGVTTIGNTAFQNCMNITNFTIYATTPPTLGTNALFNVSSNIYVPAESVETYKAASGWSSYASRIQSIPSV